ncbi:MAG: GTPase HflX [Phycisphaerae bacterium]|nr:GTPase HflX [Phycisphaerae bacterium]
MGRLAEDGRKDDNLAELASLVESAGAEVVDRFIQKVYKIKASTYIGSGKAKMLWDRVERFNADVVIFDNDLSPGQIRELEKIIEVKVIDRSELILDIFATRARTRQAKLQVELAQLEYTYPRLTRMWSHLDRVAGGSASGGVGTRGTGEKQLEIDKRLVNKRIAELKRELETIDKRKLREIGGRKGLYKVSLVGYTNAGKSTLMNAITDAGVYVKDQLFATLDTRTKKWQIEGGSEVLLSDTVGFVSHLPHQLVESFKATLEEAVNADLLLHVIDVSSEEVFEQIASVEKVLKEIGCDDKDMLILLNKSDAVSSMIDVESLQTIYPEAICVSAKTGLNMDKVAGAVLAKYKGGDADITVRCHAGDGRVLSFLRAHTEIQSEEYEDSDVVIKAKIGKSQLPGLRKICPDGIEVA